MLSENDFQSWCDRLSLSTKLRQLIKQIRSSEPSRLVSGRSNNVCGRYPSQKMGKTIQFESHRVEAPKIYELEQDENVLEYYDQPPPIKLNYQGNNGKKLGVIHTPDLFVLEKNRAGWVECKTEEQLKKLEEKKSNRYHCDADGKWRCPPGEEYAEQLGLSYTVCSDQEFNWTLQRNFLFLEDYYRAESLEINESAKNLLVATVTEQSGITLAELLEFKNDFNADDIYAAIANNDIYVDLETHLLAEPQRTRVFGNEKTAKAFELLTTSSVENTSISSPVIDLTTGSLILWDGRGRKILHAGATEITLIDENEQPITIAKSMFEDLVCQGKIVGIQSTNKASIKEEAWQKFQKASSEDQEEALRRYEAVKPYLNGTPPEIETASARTIRDWKKKYLEAQEKHGCGLIGLLSSRKTKGNRSRKLPEETIELIEKIISEDYETNKQKNMLASYRSLVHLCEQKGVFTPSYMTFTQQVKQRSIYQQTKKRQGRRAAYKHKQFYWELDRTTPRHGDRPFDIGHIDHTELDIELVC
ncbi:MAG: TnsA endonuclease N-terminal domain-containing protein, partial [Waterburya sp.]